MRTQSVLLSLLLATTTACGDDGVHHLGDAPPVPLDGSAGSDAPFDAAPQPVQLTITAAGAPVAGVKVYFQATDSTEIATMPTDATGVARAFMPHGGYVTVLDPFPASATRSSARTSSTTCARSPASSPASKLVLDRPAADPGQSVTILLPTDTAGAPYQYGVYTDCGANVDDLYIGPPPALKAGRARCRRRRRRHRAAARRHALRVWCDRELPRDLRGQRLPPDQLLHGDRRRARAERNRPDRSDGEYLRRRDRDRHERVERPGGGHRRAREHELRDAAGRLRDERAEGQTSACRPCRSRRAAGQATIALPAAAIGVRVDDLELAGFFDYQDLYRWGATPAGDGSYTFDATGLPLVGFGTDPLMYDQANNVIGWSPVDGAMPDLFLAEYDGQRQFDLGSGMTAYSSWYWQIVGPFTGASIALPMLIGDAADFNTTTATDNPFGDPNDEHLLVAKVPGGYDAVRAHAFDVLENQDLSGLASGATGHLEVDTWQPNRGLRAKHGRRRAPSPVQLLRRIQHLVSR